MNKITKLLSLSVLGVALAGPVLAQDATPPEGTTPGMQRHQEMMQHRGEMKEQRQERHQDMMEHREDMRDMHKDMMDKRQDMREGRQEMHKEMMEHKKDMRENHRETRKEHRAKRPAKEGTAR